MHAALAKLVLDNEGILVLGLVALIFLIGWISFLICCSRQSRARNRIALRRWAEQRQMQIVWIRHPWLHPWLHPWFSHSPFVAEGIEETVYRIEVLDKVGRRKKGWIACGGSLDDVNVQWDD